MFIGTEWFLLSCFFFFFFYLLLLIWWDHTLCVCIYYWWFYSYQQFAIIIRLRYIPWVSMWLVVHFFQFFSFSFVYSLGLCWFLYFARFVLKSAIWIEYEPFGWNFRFSAILDQQQKFELKKDKKCKPKLWAICVYNWNRQK